MKQISWLLIVPISAFLSCRNTPKANPEPSEPMTVIIAEQPLIVYRTVKDYSNHIPVILSDDLNNIVSYPAPSDIRTPEGGFPTPTLLDSGFLLDNRGINYRVGYLSYTYQTYSELSQAPDLKTLYDALIDKNPLIEMYECGSKNSHENPVEALNRLIKDQKIREVCSQIYPYE